MLVDAERMFQRLRERGIKIDKARLNMYRVPPQNVYTLFFLIPQLMFLSLQI